ncbi:MAG: archaeosortase/exosortase family protein [Bacteroidales bacterium]|nr:archaeosortase/exosortase family protein [Bacteroidales bacterium]
MKILNVTIPISPPKVKHLADIALFCLLTILIHYGFRYWAGHLHYYPIADPISNINSGLSQLVFHQSSFLIEHILPYPFHSQELTMYINDGYISIRAGCSGLKQFLQAALLFLIFPGPWKHKLWFIPLSIILMHLVNLLRIFLLAIVVNYQPQQFGFYHDIVFRPLFYVVIFVLWVWWVERSAK